MKFERRKIAVALALGAGVGSTLLLGAAPSMAAESIFVTGSNIPRTEVEGNSPIQVLTSEDLVRSGYTTVSEVLRDITANGQGTLSQGFNGAFATGASGVALRGLTVGATLVLIDGLRMVGYPLSDDGQRNFVDISSIPFSAIERIEVLLDGASAIYGSDAIGGVVNVILKKSFKGSQLVAEGGITSKGDGGNVHVSFTQGFGDSGGPMWGVLTAEYRHQNQITFKSRDDKKWANMDFSALGGNDIRPGARDLQVTANPILLTPYLQRPSSDTSLAANNVFLDSRCNLAMRDANQCIYTNTWSILQPETQNINIAGNFTVRLSDGWQANLAGSWFNSQAQADRRPFAVPAASLAPNIAYGPGQNPVLVHGIPVFLVNANYPGNTLGEPAIVRAFIPQIPNQRTNTDTDTIRLVGQITGTGYGWDTNLSAGYTYSKNHIERRGYVNEDVLLAALNNPTSPFLLTGGNPDAIVSAISPVVKNSPTNELDFVQLTGSRELMKLDGGPLGLALGATYVYNKLDADNSQECKDGTVAGLNCFYAVGTQKNYAFYAELNAPVFKSLELNAAARYDHYDTYGGQVVPKVGFKWTPIEQVAVRGTWGKGFRAPYITENGSAGLAYTAGGYRDPLNCPVSLPSGAPDTSSARNAVAFCSFTPTYLQTTNPDLKAEKSTNYTAGFVVEPIKNWSTSVDYYSIDFKNQIYASSNFSTFDQAAQTIRGPINSVTFGDGHQGPSPVGILAYIADFYVNANTTKTTGLDLMSNWTTSFSDMSRMKLVAQWSHIFKYDVTQEGVTYKLAGTHGPAIISGNTGNPQDRIQLTGQWAKGPFTGTLMGNYISSFNLLDPAAGNNTCAQGAAYGNPFRYSGGQTPTKYCNVASFWYWNLNLQYQYDKQTMFQFSVINLLNNQAPVDIDTYGGTGDNRNSSRGAPYNPSLHFVGVQGASFQLGLTYTF